MQEALRKVGANLKLPMDENVHLYILKQKQGRALLTTHKAQENRHAAIVGGRAILSAYDYKFFSQILRNSSFIGAPVCI